MSALTLEELRRSCTGTYREVHLLLNGGAVSVKRVCYVPAKGEWVIVNEIDGTRQWLTDAQLWTDSNIGPWLDGGAVRIVP